MDRDISFPEIDRSWRFLCRELAMRVSPPFLYLPLSLSLSLRSIYNEWTEYEFLKFEIIRQTKRYRYSLARRRRNLQVNGDKIKLQNFINFKRVSSWTNNRAITWNGCFAVVRSSRDADRSFPRDRNKIFTAILRFTRNVKSSYQDKSDLFYSRIIEWLASNCWKLSFQLSN